MAAASPVADPLLGHFENLPGPAYLWQRSGGEYVLAGYNEAATKVPQNRIATLLGRRIEQVTGSVAAEARTALDLCLAEERVVRVETAFEFPSTGDEKRQVVVTVIPVSKDTAIAHIDDVTERRLIEARLRDSLQRYELAARGTEDGLWDWNIVTGEVYWSPRWKSILGYADDELVADTAAYVEMLHPDDRDRLQQAVDEHLAHRTPIDVDVRLRHRGGHWLWVNSRGQAAWNERGEPIFMAGSIRDITARREAQQRLIESEARYRALAEANPDVVFRIDRRGVFLDLVVPDGADFPFTYDQFVGKTAAQTMGPEFAAAQQHFVEEALAKGELQIWEHQLERGPGCTVHLESRFSRSTDDEVMVIVRDVTERIELQREVIDVEARERSRIGNDIHDGLGQSLTAISLALKQLEQQLERDGSEHRASVERISESVRACIGETGRIAQTLTPVIAENYRLREALGRLVQDVNDATGVRCSLRVGAGECTHSRELETQLFRIAQESVSNALRHADASEIRIEYVCDGTQSRLEVLDDGQGIPAVEYRRAGLGLRSMRYRAGLIGATLEVARRPDGGTRVTCLCACSAEPQVDAPEGTARAAMPF
ncbi:MAG TPA: PAS domain S-box protein [Gammaproteobacteria bacterium]|nr:PAS domain S-box protein [Gammaproteobacteria bacterium]